MADDWCSLCATLLQAANRTGAALDTLPAATLQAALAAATTAVAAASLAVRGRGPRWGGGGANLAISSPLLSGI